MARRASRQLLSDKRLNAVALGPGLGVGGETRALVDVALKSGAAVVLDADAITSFKDDPEALFNRLHDRCVLTPHAGEFERLFPGLLDESASKLEATRAAAAARRLRGAAQRRRHGDRRSGGQSGDQRQRAALAGHGRRRRCAHRT